MPSTTENLELYQPDAGQSGVAAELNQNWTTLDGRFDEATGHTHDGTAGNGPPIAVTSIAAVGVPSASNFLRGDGQWAASGGGAGVTDHGDLTGLTDDDHPQYVNQGRGDARYTQRSLNLSDVTSAATARTNLGAAAATHQHAGSDITTGTVATARLGSGTANATTYLRGDQTWQPVSGSGGAGSLDDLTDVLIVSPADNQILTYDAVGGRWENATPTPPPAGNLDSLTDVTITTPAATEVLSYNGSAWVNSTPAGGTTNEQIDDRVNALIVAGTGITKTYDDTANTLTIAASGGGGAVDPLTTLSEFDDFISGTATSGTIGKLGWGFATGSLAIIDAESGRPGLLRRTTTATANAICTFFASANAIRQIFPADTFSVTWILRPTVVDTELGLRAGLTSRADSNPATDGIYFEKLPADTTWFRVTRAASSETRTNTTIAVANNAWVKLRVRRIDASTIGFTIDANAEQTATATIPIGALIPFWHAYQSTTNVHNVDLDLAVVTVSGLVR